MEIGDLIGGYRLEAVIGRGGMGVVYRATQVTLEREVALKILAPDIARDETFRARFIREARLAATIEHPNAVTVYEAGEADGVLFLAMRYIEGPDLGTVIEQESPLDASRVARVVAQVAGALDVAHERGLVHRDIKPGNILIGPGDHAYLTDFGIAKHGPDREEHLTRAGTFVGTVDFMAPEQVTGEAVDARADQYSLGAVLFTALTGQVPFPRDSEIARLFALVNDPPPAVSALRPGLPAAFDEITARALAKAPSDRYPTAGDLGRAVLAAAENATVPAPAPIAAPELGTLSAGELAVEQSTGQPPPPPVAPTVAPAPTGTTIFPAPSAPPQPPGPSRSQPSFSPLHLLALPFLALGRVFALLASRLKHRQPISTAPEVPPVPSLTDFGPPLPPLPGGVRFTLQPEFSYVHHPLEGDERLIPLLGNHDAIHALAERIEHSRGGSFLITGFRGVGKSTVVLQAIHEVRAANPGGRVVHVNLNVARPREPTELMFEVIRRLFDALDDDHLLGMLDADIHERLLTAYRRTLLTFRETRASGHERSRGVSLGITGIPGSPQADLSGKSTESLATETSFLGYTEGDVEQDFVRIVRLMRDGGSAAARNGDAQRPGALVHKVIVVFDELDKLTDREGAENIELLLRILKNLFTTANVHFVFVAGPELHDAALKDSHHGNSVYDSVFSWQLYVPCVWNAAAVLLEAVVADPGSDPKTLDELSHYLRFKARGVPRLLLKELNEFVTWHGTQACIDLHGADLARVFFYAEIDRILEEFITPGGAAPPFGVAIDADRWRIGAYYLMDAVLRTEGDSFTAASLLKEGAGRAVEAASVKSERKVTALLDYLAEPGAGVLEIVHGKDADSTYFADTPDAQTLSYRLTDDVVAKLAAFARVDERERAELVPGTAAPHPWIDTDAGLKVVGEHYELVEELDRSGMGRVYRARDRRTGQEVAVKLLDVPELAASTAMQVRFRRKARLAVELEHPNVVRTLETFTDDGVPGIVMELVNGTPLRQLMDQVRLEPGDATCIAMRLLLALEYLSEHGIIRCDLKPTGIMVDQDLNPVILDLGIAKRLHEASDGSDSIQGTRAGVAIGTPAYAAPEQLSGKEVDIRSDIFAVAAILVEMVSGRPPRGQGDLFQVLKRALNEDIAVDELPVSADLRSVLGTALERDPERRYPTPAAMNVALGNTPEGKAVAERVFAQPRA